MHNDEDEEDEIDVNSFIDFEAYHYDNKATSDQQPQRKTTS